MLNTPKYSGEPTPQALASGLATLGRYGDEYMIHAAEGETVIPAEVFESNPQLKADLFRQMAMMGIKDPNRYVVGNSLNSINPLTGQPEFFWKKAWKAVKKVFKKALPIIAPIVGNLIAPGIGGIIASGLVTKLQGGSWGDVLKGAAIGWATQGLTGGISSAMSGQTFGAGFTQGLSAPFTAASNLFSSGPANPFSQGIFGSSKALAGAGIFGKTLTPQYNPTAGTSGITAAGQPVGAVTSAAGQPVGAPVSAAGQPVGAVTSAPALADGMTASGDFSGSLSDIGGTDLSPGYDAVKLQTFRPPPAQINPQVSAASGDAFNIENSDFGAAGSIPETVPTVSTRQELLASYDANTDDPSYGFEPDTDPPGFVDRTAEQLKTYFDPSVEAAGVKRYADLAEAQKGFAADYRAGSISPSLPDGAEIPTNLLKKKSFEWLQANPVPGLLSRSAPLIAATGIAGVGIAAASGAFSEEEEEFNANPSKSDREIDAYNKWGQIADKNSLEAQKLFGIWNMKPYVTRSQFEAQTGGRSARPDWRFLPESNAMGVAMGGEVVGPGTGTSDSIPARLSDGEFVMTADAVRNAGGGNRDLGAARMYDMMRRFEGGVA